MSDGTEVHHQWDKPSGSVNLAVEAWSQGLVIGALIIMTGIATANMRNGVLLHKLILLELVIASPDCFFIFFDPLVFGWYLSSSSALMILSWQVHNVVAWIKCKPFLTREISLLYIGTVALAQGYWITEIYANYTYFNLINESLFPMTRPYEALCRDPWWIFTTVNLFWNIKKRYEFGYFEIMRISSRFAIMLTSMCLSIMFIILDVLAVTTVLDLGGLNPFWKIAFVFKCFTDTIILDDFKTALDKLSLHRRNKIRGSFSFSEGPEASKQGDQPGSHSAPVDFDGEPKSLSTEFSQNENIDMQPIRVDSVEPLDKAISPRTTNFGTRKGSREWWEHECYA